MTAPPCYADLGKEARELFTKHYHVGLVKLDCKAKSATGVNFNAVTTLLSETGKATGFLELKYKMSDQGITMKEKWNTDNTLNTEIFSEDRLLHGLKLISKLSIAPQTSKANAVVGAAYKGSFFHATADVDYNTGAPIANASLVHSYKGFLAGYQLGFTPRQIKPSKANVLCGYSCNDILMLVNMNDFKEYGLLLNHHVRPDTQAGVSASWNSATNQAVLAVGGIFTFNKETILRAKVNNVGSLGLSLTHRLREGIDVTVCANVDFKNYSQGDHKFGLGVNLEG